MDLAQVFPAFIDLTAGLVREQRGAEGAVIFNAVGNWPVDTVAPGVMLADPYFPNFGQMDDVTQAIIGRYYDFLVRYEEVLALNTTDATDRADALTTAGIETEGRRSRDRVAVVVRAGEGFETFSLVNLMGLASGRWDTPLVEGPTPLVELSVRINANRPVIRAWWASPDGEERGVLPLEFSAGEDDDGPYIAFTLPRLDYWDMIVLEYRP